MSRLRWTDAADNKQAIDEIMAEAYTMRTRDDEITDDNRDQVLRDFVFESNEIEGYPRDKEGQPGGHLFDDHLRACQIVHSVTTNYNDPARANFYVLRPQEIHRLIMEHETDIFPGELRQCAVMVGGRPCMSPKRVRKNLPELMDKAWDWVREIPSDQNEDTAGIAWDFHHEFEFIHPFIDGNGRTGRLWLNALRLYVGLPWLTIYAQNRHGYYKEITDWIERKGS